MTANTDEPGQPVLLRCNEFCDSEREPVLLPVGEVSEGATRGLELHWVSNACQSRAILTEFNRSFNSETGFAEVGPIYETQENQEAQPFLIAEGPVVLGGGSFCLRRIIDQSEVFSFTWLWTFPSARGQGIYSVMHPVFLKRFGRFYPERPLSDGMRKLLDRIDKAMLAYSDEGLPMKECYWCDVPIFLDEQLYSLPHNGNTIYYHLACLPKQRKVH